MGALYEQVRAGLKISTDDEETMGSLYERVRSQVEGKVESKSVPKVKPSYPLVYKSEADYLSSKKADPIQKDKALRLQRAKMRSPFAPAGEGLKEVFDLWDKTIGFLARGTSLGTVKEERISEQLVEIYKPLAGKYAPIAALPATLVADPLNFISGGARGIAGAIRLIRFAKTPEKAFEAAKVIGFSDDVAEQYKSIFAATKTDEEAKKALEAAVKLQNTTKLATKELPQQATTGGRATAQVIRETTGQGKRVRITLPERTALGSRFRQQARGAEEAAKATRTVIRLSRGEQYERAIAELSEATKRTVQALKDIPGDVAKVKQIITDYARAKLSPELRGQLLSAVNKAKTRGDVASAVRRVNILRNDEIKKEIVGEIEGFIEKIDVLPPNQRTKALTLVDSLTTESFSKASQAKLAQLKEFLTEEPEALFKFGAKTLKKVERATQLGKRKLKDIEARELIKIRDRLEHLLDEGKLSEKTTESIKELRVSTVLDELKGSRNLNENLPPPRKPGEKEAGFNFSGAYNSTREALRQGTQYYVSPDVGFQILDNEKWRGANWRIFKRPMDDATGLENEMRNEIIDNLFVRIKDIETKFGKLNRENYENVMLHATLKQVGGREKLLKSDSRVFTEAFLDGVKLSEGEEEFYKMGREIFDDLRPHIERVLWNTRGEKLGKVDNYWSWITDFDNSDEVFMRLAGDYKNTSRTEQGFTKSRTLVGTQKLNLNALDVLVKHINDSSAFIHKEELLNHLGKIARSEKYEQAVGKLGQKWVLGWIDLISRGGTPKGFKPGFATLLVRNIGHGVLGFRISPILKQPLAKIVSTGLLGKESFMYDPQFYSNLGIREAIHKVSQQQRFRNFDDPSYTALAKSKKLATWQRWGYQGIKTFDSYTADSVWYAAYRKNLKDRGLNFSFSVDEFTSGKNIDKEAQEWADLITRRTQGSSEYKDAPLMYAAQSNKDFVMAFLQFQRFIHNQSILWRDAKVALTKEKDPIKAASIATSLVAAGIAESYVQTGIAQVFSSEDYAKKEREKSIGARVFNTITGQIPIISNLTGIAEYGGSGIPIWDIVVRQGAQGAERVITGKTAETKLKGATRVGEAVASGFGISGAGQTAQIIRKFIPEVPSQSKSSGLPKKQGREGGGLPKKKSP